METLIARPGPKKLLSIDGGGIRGLIALGFLARIESLLRQQLGRPDLVLAEYFDYVGGTSTGAIIATLISLGYSTDEIRTFYQTGARTMFEPSNVFLRLRRRFSSRRRLAGLFGVIGMLVSPTAFTQKALEAEIKSVVGDATLGTERLRTLLLIVMRNATTDSPWPISNNPKALYNRKGPGCNLDLPLWQLVRASTAAPVFFPPEEIHIPGVAKPFVFVDGGITVYNNPAFLLFLMATLPPYRLGWAAGERNLLLVSVGTGLCESANLDLRTEEMNLLYNVQSLPAALMRAATVEQDLLCRVFGKHRASDDLDSEIGSLQGLQAPVSEKLFTYARYNVELSDENIANNLHLDGIRGKDVQPLDGIDHLDALQAVGNAAAQRAVSLADFEGFLFAQSKEAQAPERSGTS
ncbi:MAG TPA: patatin-like phospholipase family protein [Candidatus Tyrphobacter sp.]